MATSTVAQYLRVPPGELIIADNIRKTITLDPEFVKSIKQHGVIVPIQVEPTESGAWSVVDGQLRTLAAVDAGRADVPIVTEDPKDAAARMIEQLIVNDHRSAVIDSDRASAFQALFTLGVSADTIARKTNVPKKRVETALAVASSPFAVEILETGNVTLDQAATILEFEESPELAELVATTALNNPRQFDHTVAQAREQLLSDRSRDALIEQLTAEGYTITDEIEASHGVNGTIARIDYLFTDKECKERVANTPQQRIPHVEGLKAALRENYGWDGNVRVRSWVPVFFIDGWSEAGYFVEEWRMGNKAPGGGLTDAEREKRRETRENNKLWVPASEVRRGWIKELLQRKDLPAGWEMFVAQYVARPNSEHNYTFAMLILGGKRAEEWLTANPTKAPQYLIAEAIASVEGTHEFNKDGWRHHLAPSYIAQLSKWGYTLSDLEKTVAKTASK